MEDELDDAERTRPPLMADLVGLCRKLNERNARYLVLWKTKQTNREKDEIDCSFLRKLLEDRGEWSVE